jgi:predicted ABC-type transport system involved in lysophospholipase L1 biosynthesis ATPase subunit
VLDLLAEIRERRGMTVIVVSYDPQVGDRADRMVTVTDGVLRSPETDPSAAPSA